MHYSILREIISLLKEIQSQQSDTGGSVYLSLEKAIVNLEPKKGDKFSEQESIVTVLYTLERLFSELPEIREKLNCLSGL